MVRVLNAEQVHAQLGYAKLAVALERAFAEGQGEAPVRQAYEVGFGGMPAHLLTMPVWRRGDAIGVKLVNVFPGNSALGQGAVNSLFVLFDGKTGAPHAIIDGEALTNRRTAASSALASKYLSRPDSRTLVVVGTGHLSPHLAAAHCTARAITRVLVWGRSADKTGAMAARLRSAGMAAEAISDLPAALAQADIVTCATTSTVPLVLGQDVKPGTHVDLVGAFTRAMRESDDALIAKSEVYVDTRGGALAEAGDLLQPVAAGTWSLDLLRGDLFDLCSGAIPGRRNAGDITVFKSVGTAIEDLVAAELATAEPPLARAS